MMLGRIEWSHPRHPREHIPWLQPISRPPSRCPVCEGRQTMPESFYARRNPMPGDSAVKCRSCNGRGVL